MIDIKVIERELKQLRDQGSKLVRLSIISDRKIIRVMEFWIDSLEYIPCLTKRGKLSKIITNDLESLLPVADEYSICSLDE